VVHLGVAPRNASIDADESGATRWRRRLGTVAALFVATVAWCASLPTLIPLAVGVDVVRRARFGATRFVALIAVYLVCECAGVLASAWIWLTRGRDHDAWVQRNFRLQNWWAGTLFAAGARLYGLRVQVDGADSVAPGPVVLLVRHSSVADTLVPAVFVSARLGLLLKYVLKRELLLDPCLDIVGQRLPNVFVRRGGADPAREVANVRRLAQDLGSGEGVIVFPEGTRFSPKRRAEALTRLAASDPALARRAAGLTATLPPRLGGTLALLDAAPDADVVVCGHVGFDGVRRLGDLWNGALVGRAVHVTFWRCPRATIPTDRAGQTDWLYTQWERLDAWVNAANARATQPASR